MCKSKRSSPAGEREKGRRVPVPSILFLSSDIDELLDMSDRILIMHEGLVIKEYPRQEVNKHQIMVASEGFSEDKPND